MSNLSFWEILEQNEALMSKILLILVPLNYAIQAFNQELWSFTIIACGYILCNVYVGLWYCSCRPQYLIIKIWYQCFDMQWEIVSNEGFWVTLCLRYSRTRASLYHNHNLALLIITDFQSCLSLTFSWHFKTVFNF